MARVRHRRVAHRTGGGTGRALALSSPMRGPSILLALAILTACDRSGESQGGQPGIVANIVEKTLPAPPAAQPADNGIDPVETPPSMDGPPPPRAPAGLIPVLAQGRWTGLSDRCGDASAALDLRVGPDRLLFHESEGMVESVESRADGRYAVRASFTGEGQSWSRTLLMRPSGDRLVIANDGEAVTRKRC